MVRAAGDHPPRERCLSSATNQMSLAKMSLSWPESSELPGVPNKPRKSTARRLAASGLIRNRASAGEPAAQQPLAWANHCRAGDGAQPGAADLVGMSCSPTRARGRWRKVGTTWVNEGACGARTWRERRWRGAARGLARLGGCLKKKGGSRR